MAMRDDDAGLDGLLAGFSTGALSPAMHALVAAHLTMSDANAAFVAAMEGALASEALSASAPPLADREARLAAIFDARQPRARAIAADGPLPAPLRSLIGQDFEQLKWRSRLPGVKEHRLAGVAEGEANLYWIKAGRKMPRHTHEGSEVTLVLKGAFRDLNGHYKAGDISIADAAVDHQPIVDAVGDCICFAVTDAPLRLTGPVGRIVGRLFGRPQ